MALSGSLPQINLGVQGGKRITVNIDQVRVYRPRISDTISSYSHVETLYEGQRSSDRSSRSQPGKFKGSRKTSSEQINCHKSSEGNAGWEDPRLKRKIESNGSGDRKDLKRSKICRKRSLQGSEHRNQKRPTPEPKQGIKRAIPSSVSSLNYKYRRPNNRSQGSQSIAGHSPQQDSRQDKSPTERSRHDGSGQFNKARETKTTKNGTNRSAERRHVWSKQATAVRPCPYYLRSRSLVYADKPQTLDHLEDNIRHVIADIRPQMLEKVIENWTSRLDYIRASRGSPMPEINIKM
ncbi:uncharacterized protein TNCV_3032801 [Trichonephila clavipes]|nr:uncharacterized protein TNCV_3032801 [Trichonephila clavipes]